MMRLTSALLVFALAAIASAACTTEKTIVQQIVVTPTPGQQQLVPPAQPVPTEPPAPPPTLPAPAPVQPIAPQPVAPQQPAADPRAGCEPAYPSVCIPVGPDLDCGDISARRFTVLPPDPHRFDNDGDGIGCES